MPLRLAVFDFDLTLSVEHVYHYLAGGGPPPAAKTEVGQLARIAEHDRSGAFGGGGFAKAMLGGTSRILELEHMLKLLHSLGVECIVCTKGLVGPVRKILYQTGLSRYFSGVYGNTADTYGSTDFDARANLGEDAQFLATQECQLPGRKPIFLAQYMRSKQLSFDEVVFIDDTMDEVRQMQQTCRVIHVSSEGGMDGEIIAEICTMAREGRNSKAALGFPPPKNEGEQVFVWSKGHNRWLKGVITPSVCDVGLVEVQYYTPESKAYLKVLEANSPHLQRPNYQGCRKGEAEDSLAHESEADEACGKRKGRRNRNGPCCTQ